jgi:hypothetical protein
MTPQHASRLLQLKKYLFDLKQYIVRLRLDPEFEATVRELQDLWTITVDNAPLYSDKELDEILQNMEQAIKELAQRVKLEVE